jgi:PPM family protein phosphatase
VDDQLSSRIKAFLSSDTSSRTRDSTGEYALATTVGLVRTQNQDAALIARARYAADRARDFDLAVLCDGLGGMREGAEASALGLSIFVSTVVHLTRASTHDILHQAISRANDGVFKLLRAEGGTTLSAIMIPRNGPTAICHVGDSRIYALSDGDLRQLTHDDTLRAALNKKPQAEFDSRDSRLLQFVGMGRDLEPHISKGGPESTKRYLLTSDGAHDVPNNLLQRVIATTQHNFELTRKLILLSEIVGGLDNATAVALPALFGDELEHPLHGLELSLLAPFGRLNICIQQVSDRNPSSPEPPLSGSGPSEDQADHNETRNVAQKHREAPGSRKFKKVKRKNLLKKEGQQGDELPLSDTLVIQFPEPDED